MTEQIYTDQITGKKYVKTGEYRKPRAGEHTLSSYDDTQVIFWSRNHFKPKSLLKEYIEEPTPELVPKYDKVQSHVFISATPLRRSAQGVILGWIPTTELIAAACATVNGEDNAIERLRAALESGFAEPKPKPRYFTQGYYVHDRTRGAGSYAPYTAETDKLAQQLADTLNETENNNA